MYSQGIHVSKDISTYVLVGTGGDTGDSGCAYVCVCVCDECVFVCVC